MTSWLGTGKMITCFYSVMRDFGTGWKVTKFAGIVFNKNNISHESLHLHSYG